MLDDNLMVVIMTPVVIEVRYFVIHVFMICDCMIQVFVIMRFFDTCIKKITKLFDTILRVSSVHETKLVLI